ncbi:MAG: hypothetical protein ISR50_17695 [Alphaproteobacteria bacterium]|nr:hypothetical protein [Alphaproteobacteria bacterium]
MSEKSHFEIMSYSGSRWDLEAIAPSHEDAIARANDMMERTSSSALKVNRLSFSNATGEFREKEVLFLGTRPSTARTHGDGVDAGSPCQTLEQVFSLQSRQAIRRVMRQWLDAHQVTPVELLHLPEYINRFQASGSMLQSTVQRAALAQAGAYKLNAKLRQRELYDLVDEVAAKARLMWRTTDLIPVIEGDGLDGLVDRLGDAKDQEYIFNAALANWLRRFKTGPEKFLALLDMVAGSKRPAAIIHLDEFLADFLESANVVATVIGKETSLGGAVLRLAALINPGAATEVATAAAAPAATDAATDTGAGKKRPRDPDEIYDDSGDGGDEIPEHPAVEKFRQMMRLESFPKCRQSLIRRMEQTLTGPRSFTGQGTLADAQILGQLHARLCNENGKFALGAELGEAFVVRSQTYIGGKSIGDLLDGVTLPLPRVKILLDVEKGIFGKAGRQRIGDYIMAILEEPENQAVLRNPDTPPAIHMRNLAGIQRLIGNASISNAQKEAAAAVLDDICIDILDRGQILAKIADRSSSNIDECMSILKLCAAGSFTEGRAAELARSRATAVMRAPGFAEAFLRRGNDRAEMQKMLVELEMLMAKAGISSLPLMGAMASAQA